MSEGSDVLVVSPSTSGGEVSYRASEWPLRCRERARQSGCRVPAGDARPEGWPRRGRRRAAESGDRAGRREGGLSPSLGTAYRAAGRLDRVMGCYQQALALRPDFAEVHNDLGNLHAERGDLDAAIVCLRRPSSSGRTSPRPTSTWGPSSAAGSASTRPPSRSRQRCGPRRNSSRQPGAWGTCNGAEAGHRRLSPCPEHRPDDFEVHNELGIVLARLRRYAEAEASYREAIRLAPGYAEAINDLGITHARQAPVRRGDRLLSPGHRAPPPLRRGAQQHGQRPAQRSAGSTRASNATARRSS